MRSSLIHADLMRSNAASRQGADGISTVTPEKIRFLLISPLAWRNVGSLALLWGTLWDVPFPAAARFTPSRTLAGCERLFSVVPMYSTIAAALLTQQVLTQTPCYAALVGLCSDPPKHTMMVIPAPSHIDGWMPIQPEETPSVTDVSLRSRDRVHP